jgi:heme-degrading monooxygenase HmoA
MAHMVLEVAQFDITPGAEAAFEAAYRQARQAVADSAGCRSMRMTRGVETPTRFVLLIEWDSVERHEEFRASERYPRWRAAIGPHFANPPQVEHFTDLP